jgi:hypothetical protein
MPVKTGVGHHILNRLSDQWRQGERIPRSDMCGAGRAPRFVPKFTHQPKCIETEFLNDPCNNKTLPFVSERKTERIRRELL